MFSRCSRSKLWLVWVWVFAAGFLWRVSAQQDPRQVGLPSAPQAQRKVALVMGNGAYQNIRKLKNPANDATDMAAALKDLGFELIGGGPGLNLSKVEMERLISEFGRTLRNGGVGVFYYAGHGVLLANGKNYLIPVDIAADDEADMEYKAVELQYLLNKMGYAGNGLNIVILDACRNNPFEGRVRDASDGLGEMKAAAGTFIAYAAAPGKTAQDGDGRNGAYTAELLKQIKTPGLSMVDLFQNVSSTVYQTTKRRQEPWQSSSPLTGRFCFGGCETNMATKPTVTPTPFVVDKLAVEREYWDAIKNSRNVEDFQEYLAEVTKGTYPGTYAAIARSRVRELTAANRPPEVKPTPVPAPVPTPLRTRTAEETFYENARTADDYCAYLRQYPGGQFAALARPRAGNCFIIPANPRVGDYAKSPPTNIELAWIPEGNFMMGSPDNEKDRDTDEGPQKHITFSRGFWMGRYEVTQAQYQAVTDSNPSGFKDCPTCPVENVSWGEAQEFIKQLNAKNDVFTYSLPSEAQWEYAARAGTTTRFYWGDDLDYSQLPKYANRSGRTTPVGSLNQPNAWGLHDMSGNVAEWCEDTFADSLQITPADGSANTTVESKEYPGRKAVRSGSWLDSNPRILRSALRNRSEPGRRNSALGFRVAARVRTQ